MDAPINNIILLC